MRTLGGRKVLKARRLKGRNQLAPQPRHAKHINWNAG
jgi:hypothetical protein